MLLTYWRELAGSLPYLVDGQRGVGDARADGDAVDIEMLSVN
ncbi:hypothetical protein [Halapricum hydrolyticum]|uniref:Uncharacterized protein n=1 Tax=Halapricum hydrolyticum TaxID=2979991 RepID=A0AAE3LFC6_9EURY|nr:hypothetical protein [Halapricum hydrolyticum]MCU4718509.1 hypothetical protein [Halapricum hydrolyticum]MCU4727472.1 hypothetical protein [Halapricum hydrolyticum]